MELDDAIVERAGQGELAALVELDSRGFLAAEDEACADYAGRLRRCRERTLEFEKSMAGEDAAFRVPEDGLEILPSARIPASLFGNIGQATGRLYGFAIDWVPGFYKNCGLLFGGGAYAFPPDFFSIFIINESFARQERWLIYHRDELLAHELCHVARSGFASPRYEEFHAYQTASTGFRRWFGGIVHRERDSYMFLLSAAVILAGQMLRVFGGMSATLPLWPFWIPFALVSAFLLARHLLLIRDYRQAAAVLASACLPGREKHILFRCSDAEIAELARVAPGDLPAWVASRPGTPRWRVIRARFFPGGAGQ